MIFPDSRLRGLYVITDSVLGNGHLPITRAALRGGARIIQLRDKTTPPRELIPIAHEMRRLTREFGALFMVNDRIDLALLCEADGVHLGPDDWPINEARRVLGDKIIGLSSGTVDEAIEAEKAGANYIGVGAVFGTSTKSDAGEAIGTEGLRAIVQATTLPCAAIGGINSRNLGEVLAVNPAMICVISAIANAGDEQNMEAATRSLVSSTK